MLAAFTTTEREGCVEDVGGVADDKKEYSILIHLVWNVVYSYFLNLFF